jgi:RNA polymerase sigma factor (sigma-70 family)
MKSEGAVDRRRSHAHPHPCAGRGPLRLDPRDERELQRRLRRWSRRCLGLPDAEFEDAYQVAWRKVLETERRGRRTRNLEHALRWGIHNAWLEECRRRRRRPATSLEDATEVVYLASSASDPSELIERREAASYVFEAVGMLTERQMRIVLLRDVCELKPDEVCEHLSITRRTYRQDHARGLREITARLGELVAGSSCVRYAEVLLAYAERRATAAQIHTAQRHLRNCRPCRSRVAATRRAARARGANAVGAAEHAGNTAAAPAA